MPRVVALAMPSRAITRQVASMSDRRRSSWSTIFGTTCSLGGRRSGQGRPPVDEPEALLEHVRDLEDVDVLVAPADDLHADRETGLGPAAGDGDGRLSGQVERVEQE